VGFNSAFKWVKIVINPGNERLNNLNDPVLNVLTLLSVCTSTLSWGNADPKEYST